jgi:hypothetical protein
MSADGEDKFEENLEGENFGSIDDWETELGLKIIKIEDKLSHSTNAPVVRMLQRKLVTYNVALTYLHENEKSALMIGSKGGLQSIIAYLTKQATDSAAEEETKRYSDAIMVHLPGYKMFKGSAAAKLGGFAPVKLAKPVGAAGVIDAMGNSVG